MPNLFNRTARWWRKKYILNYLHKSVVRDYYFNISTMCDFPKLLFPKKLIISGYGYRLETQRIASLKREIKKMFVVPRLKKFDESQNRIRKCQAVELFLSFLLQLLYHKTDSIIAPVKDRIENLEKELRFLLTIFGDISRVLCDKDEREAEFQNLLEEFEAVANQAGSFVHSLLLNIDGVSEELDEVLVAVLNLTDLLKASLQSSICTSAYAAPRTSIVDSVLILDSLVEYLENLLKREDDRIADLKDQINLLHQQLILVHSSINDMRLPQASEIGELKEPLMRIGDMSNQAEYLITSFLVRDVPLWYLINRLTDINHNIELITAEFQIISKTYQFGGLKVAKNFRAEIPLQDKRNTEVNDQTVGFEDKETDILHQLVGGGTESLKVISIFGMPGLGKTTLAKKLYSHPSVSDRFDKLSWCVVSQTYQKQSILGDILIHINSEFGKDTILNMEEESLVEHIYKTLKGRRYLIIMDDVWDINVWDALRRCFPDDGNGSRILLTSRNKDVAPPNSIIHELPFLSNDQCWQLLEKKVFGSRTCPPELQGIGKKIAAKCCGLPLTVVVISGILSTVEEEESTWEQVRGSLASYIDGENNSVMQILEMSYKHLPDHLKPCFLYFGAFKEDEEISVGNLKRLWVAEGFIRRENEKSTENIAEEYLMELIDKSLVMVAKRRSDGRGVKACIIHDLLRDLCLKKSKEESFMNYLKSDYIAIYEKAAIFEKARVRVHGFTAALSYGQHVRSFTDGGPQYPSFYFYVRDMRLLRVLHFFYIHHNSLYGIEYLVNLRFLVIGSLPPCIESLLNLEYLFVTSVDQTIYLPPSILKMKKLRYLNAWYDAEYSEDWKSSETNNLEFLSLITINKFKDEEMLKCSPHLCKLKCKYTMSVYEIIDLSFLTQLESLRLQLNKSPFKAEISLPSNIKKLSLVGLGIKLRRKTMLVIGRLENLEILKLTGIEFEGNRWDTKDDEFQKLRYLKLDRIEKLTQWNVGSTEHFPRLQQLVLRFCIELREIPSEIGEIPTMQMIKVEGPKFRKSLVESAQRIQKEQWDMGNEELRVIIVNAAW